MKVGDLVRAPYTTMMLDSERSEWEGKVGIVIGFDNRFGSEGFVKVMIQDNSLVCFFDERSLEAIHESR